MIIELFLAAATLQSSTALPRPAVQTCPDGSVILVTDRCISFPSHRYHLTHQPARREVTERWWCGGSSRPIEVTVRFEDSDKGTNPRPTHKATLMSLMIEGHPAPATLHDKLRSRLAALDRVFDLDGRCLFVQTGGAIGVLTLRHGGGDADVELR